MESARERIFSIPPIVVGLVATLSAIHLLVAFVLPMEASEALLELFAFDPLRYVANGAGEALPGGVAADGGALVLSWRHIPLLAASAWRPAATPC